MRKLKEIRQKNIRKRKNFFPTLILIIILWGMLGGIIYFVDPSSFTAIPLFFILLFLAFLFTFSTVFANTRKGVIVSTALIVFLILRFWGVGNILNALLIAGIAIATEFYLLKNS